jgi:hypothetical protein
MSEQVGEGPIPTVAEVVEQARDEDAGSDRHLIECLIAREDRIADALRIAGTQLGTYPELVAKVLADVGLGTPVSAEVKAMLDMQFIARINWLNEQIRRQQGG